MQLNCTWDAAQLAFEDEMVGLHVVLWLVGDIGGLCSSIKIEGVKM